MLKRSASLLLLLGILAFVAPTLAPAAVVLDAASPAVKPAWNVNWAHANGKLKVRLAGTGLEEITTITLTSATGTIASALLAIDPETGELSATFPKGAAFTALVPVGATRGDTVALQVGVVTAAETLGFDRTIRIVGKPRHGKH
jgi:hypothetical protein